MFKKEFDTSYVGFMEDGAKWLVENTDIKLVGKIEITVYDLGCFLFFFSPVSLFTQIIGIHP